VNKSSRIGENGSVISGLHDASNTCECPKREDRYERTFCADAHLDVPNHWDREEGEQEVCGDIDNGVEKSDLCEDLSAEASGVPCAYWRRTKMKIPPGLYWDTLEDLAKSFRQ
jgi:hypothetical protein